MAKALFANNAVSTLASDLTAEAQTIQLSEGGGVRFPDIGNSEEYFMLTLIGMSASGNEDAWEVVKVVSRAGDVLTVVRAQEGTVARTWGNGTRVELRLTAGSLASFATEADVNRLTSGKLDKSGGVMSGPILFDGELNLGNAGTALTIDWSKDQAQISTLTANCTLTFIPPQGAFRGVLKLFNSAATARAVTWPAGIRCLGGVAPQAPDAKIGAVALYAVYWDGVSWWVSGGRYS